MLASLLPGTRELRTALASGYAWLFAAYLLAYRVRLDTEHQLSALRDLDGFLGRTATFGILSFVAYLVGAATTSATIHLLTRCMERFNSRSVTAGVENSMPNVTSRRTDPAVDDALYDIACNINISSWWHETRKGLDAALNLGRVRGTTLRRYLTTSKHSGQMTDYYEMLNALRIQVGYETTTNEVLDRLLFKNRDIYFESDRHRAEAEFRLGVLLPGFAIVVGSWVAFSLSVTAHIVISVALLAVLLLAAIDGAGRLQRSYEMVGFAVSEGVIATPTLDVLKRVQGLPRPAPSARDRLAPDSPSNVEHSVTPTVVTNDANQGDH